jgi:predicted nuclease of predicted toxin-antitoxin system
MLRLAIDENFNHDILRGLIRRQPELDAIRVHEAGLKGADDPTVLEWAAQEKRLLLTHDVTTMTKYAYDRVRLGQSMPGVIQVGRGIPISEVIAEILLIVECSLEGEWEGKVGYLPL